MDTIGDILRHHIPNMGIYLVQFLFQSVAFRYLFCEQEYCVNEGTAIRLLQTLRTQDPELSAHLNVESSLLPMFVTDFAIAPSRRPCR